MNAKLVVRAFAVLFCGLNVQAQIWNNAGGNNVFSDAANWDGGVFPQAGVAGIDLTGDNRCIMSEGQGGFSLKSIYVGYAAADGMFEQTGGILDATVHPSAHSRIGGNGKTGTWIMSGGKAKINAVQLGLGEGSTGRMSIRGGEFIISRGGNSNTSLQIGLKGTGVFEISGGLMRTRSVTRISCDGTFSVIGSGAAEIGIGSESSGDGVWIQEAGGTLKVAIDETAVGVSRIFVDDVGEGGGDVTFEKGALLDVGFLAARNPGTFVVMQWEGTVIDNGLAFAPGVNTAEWSFYIDEVSKCLIVATHEKSTLGPKL